MSERIQRLMAADVAREWSMHQLPCAGLEPVVSGALLALKAGDWWVPGLREATGAVLREQDLSKIGLHSRPYKIAPACPAPGLRALYAVGLADDGDRALVHLGIGSASDGAFYEALNIAALRKASVVFLVAVHPLTGAAPVGQQLSSSVAEVASGLGISAIVSDGCTEQSVQEAVAQALSVSGPQVVIVHLAEVASA